MKTKISAMGALMLLTAACATSAGAGRDAGSWTTGPTSHLSPEQVRAVQRSLLDAGVPASVTGRLDAETQRALATFQQKHGLEPSGKLDERTIAELKLDPREIVPVRGEQVDELDRGT